MNLASVTEGVSDFVRVNISDPVIEVRGAPEDQDDASSCRIADKALQAASLVIEAGDIGERVVETRCARPGINGADRFVGNTGHVCHDFGH